MSLPGEETICNNNEEEEINRNEEEEEENGDDVFVPKIPDFDNSKDEAIKENLKKLPTWEEEGPSIVESNPPKKFDPKYKPKSEINSKVSFLMRGDSSRLAVDAVVNAANSQLAPGGGICGILHYAAGGKMANECYSIGYTPTGKCAVTLGYNLPAKYCIHTVGPIGENPEMLEKAYSNTLKCIDGKKIRSVALCCISTGIYGYPIKPATQIALETVRKFLEDPNNREKTDRIVFVVFEKRDVVVYNQLRHIYFPLNIEYKYAE
jgi:O-acetyl-ADP-ribose deacetylase (regulator of RNase III)